MVWYGMYATLTCTVLRYAMLLRTLRYDDYGLRLRFGVSRRLDLVRLRMIISTRVSRVVRSPSATGSRCVSCSGDYVGIFCCFLPVFLSYVTMLGETNEAFFF